MKRLRHLRKDQATRDSMAEVSLKASNLVQPFFVIPGENRREPIVSMPGVERLSPDLLAVECERVYRSGLHAVLLFGVLPAGMKGPGAEGAFDAEGPVPRAIRLIKKNLPELRIITDICLCAYTDHGHCGFVHDGEILNDESIEALARMALVHAGAGADVVAPSAMMDGQVGAIRQALDAKGFASVDVLGYSAKFASRLYGPFREAAASAPGFGDRKTYQMDFRNASQAIAEVEADLTEGAASVMVKPAHWYADIVRQVKDRFSTTPLFAYQVSGEYSMLKFAAQHGVLDEKQAMIEALFALRRAGADYVITYYAREISSEL